MGETQSESSGGVGCVGVFILLFLVALAIAIAVTLLPLAGLWIAYRWWSRRPTTAWNMLFTGTVVAGSIALAGWMWPQEYVAVRYSEDVPDVVDQSVSTAEQNLTYQGFHNIQVVETTEAAPSDNCLTLQDPQSDHMEDTRQTVTLWVTCG